MADATSETSSIDLLLRFFSGVTPLSAPAADAIRHQLALDHYPRKHVLHQQQRVATHLYFVASGLVRSFYVHDGREVTTYFGFENCVVCALDSLLSGEPSYYNIETLEDSEIISLAFKDLEGLYNDFHEIERLGRLMISRYYLEQEALLRALRFKTAEERYRELETTSPGLLQRAPLGHLASFLGITQATLSRIRSKY